MAESIIKVENLVKSFGDHEVLKKIDFEISKGEVVCIIGSSGSGKSTLLRCINHLETPTGGKILFHGEEVKNTQSSLSKYRSQVGMVFQSFNLFNNMTVLKNCMFGVQKILHLSKEEAKLRAIKHLREVGMAAYINAKPAQLSGGQKQRVSMAGVMIDDVDILLFDEPLANLDPATGKKAIALIDRIQKEQKKTIVIIEHRLEDVLYKDVDRIVVVGDGTIVADMKPDDLLVGNILEEQGIREPLYVTALKHAGCTITAQDHPQHVETMNFEPYKTQVREWFETTQIPQKQETQEKVLKVDHLHFSYQPEKAILSDISFDVKKGEMISIVGKNGAGKTTLSNLICGFLEPSKGKIELNGNDISPLSVKERGEHIGIVMQNPNQMISKPMIYEEVALGLTVRGVPEEEIRERVHETLKICGLYQFRNWPVSALSFGQKKRVTIASILVMKPEILILDEPTAGQDYRHYTEIMEFLKTINETQGTTIIMITHDMHLMLEYTNRAIVVADGQLLTIDTPAKVLTDETITAPAYLKQTSLYEMAVKCGIEDPSQFVQRFINYERAVR
mgnify:CR=1 FL=1